MRPTHAGKRRDANEPEIVDALEAVGASVLRANEVDLIVGYRERSYLIECKSEGGKLTPFQQDMLKTWRGHYAVVYSVDEALRVIGAVA